MELQNDIFSYIVYIIGKMRKKDKSKWRKRDYFLDKYLK